MVSPVVDQRATDLYVHAGFLPRHPPSPIRLARVLLGPDAVSILGRHEAHLASPLCVVSRTRWEIRLHEDMADAQICFSVAQALARWSLATSGPLAAGDAHALAVAIALPREAYEELCRQGLDPEEMATMMTLPIEVVETRQGSAGVRSVRRLRAVGAVEDFASVANDAG